MKKLIFAVIALAMTSTAYAGKELGGGDTCEDRIKVVRDDIADWIKKGGPNGLKLPSGLTVGKYSADMLGQIGKAGIRCVGQGDAGYPVSINGTPKVCRFDLNGNNSLVTCDFVKFNQTSDSDQYVLVHHEFAGLAGFEQPNGDSSNYPISNQITEFLEETIDLKLAVKDPPSACTTGGFWNCADLGQPIAVYVQRPLDPEPRLVAFLAALQVRYSDDACFIYAGNDVYNCVFDDDPTRLHLDQWALARFLGEQLQWNDDDAHQLFSALLKDNQGWGPFAINSYEKAYFNGPVKYESADKTVIFEVVSSANTR